MYDFTFASVGQFKLYRNDILYDILQDATWV